MDCSFNLRFFSPNIVCVWEVCVRGSSEIWSCRNGTGGESIFLVDIFITEMHVFILGGWIHQNISNYTINHGKEYKCSLNFTCVPM